MSNIVVRALRISTLVLIGTVGYEIAKQIAFPNMSTWESHVLTTLLITSSTFLVSVLMMRREEESRSVLELRLQEIGYLRLLIEQSRDGMLVIDAESFRVLETNETQASMLGYTPEEMHQFCVWDWEAQFTPEEFWKTFPRIRRDGALFETKHRRKDGTVFDAEVSVGIAYVGDKCLFCCIVRDISARKAGESALRESEKRCRESEAELLSFVENSPFGIFRTHVEEDRFLSVNPAVVKMLGYASAEELLAKRLTTDIYLTPQEREKTLAPLFRNGVNGVEVRCKRKDGEAVILQLSGRLAKDLPTGEMFEGIAEDITERKQVEQSLRESELRFRHAVEGAPLGMYIQTDGILRYFNPAALSMLGAESSSELVGRGFLEIIAPDSRAAVTERARLVLKERQTVPFLEERLLRLDGGDVYAEVTAIPFTFEGRAGALVFVRDITERKREDDRRHGLEAQLQQAQKMEAVGRLAGGIAHDFNNLLMVIQSYTAMLQDRLPAQDGLRRNTEQVLKAAHRAANLTSQLLAFSRKQITTPVVLDLNSVIDDTAKMLSRLIGEDIEFRVHLAKPLWTISADTGQIVQVLMNFCVNSRDAMPQGGMLTIATENFTVSAEGIDSHPEVAPGKYVKLTVVDTGMGMRKELQEQIFEPFFTTKEVGKGSGLGLAMVYGVVKQSGGYVWVESEYGQGACFTVCLPSAKTGIDSHASAKAAVQPRGAGTVLIAEDEEAVREAICLYLRTLGYTVLAASSGQEALDVARAYKGHIDLLIADTVMPKIGGRELSHTLGRSCPSLKTIHMSGYSNTAMLIPGTQDMDAIFLQKPFDLSTLARAVSETLERSERVH